MSSLHNALEQYPRLLQAFGPATGLLETEEGIVRLGETLTPTIDIWNGRREWALLRGEQWYAKRISVAAGGAGTIAAVGLGNPAGSGIAAVLMAASFAAAAGDQGSLYLYSYATATAQWGAGGFTGVPMDRRRVGLAAASQCQVISGNTPVGIPAGGFEVETQRNAALVTMPFHALPQMLYAGDAVVILNNTVATTIGVNLVWYERKCVVNEARG